jgi:hypothetical protein
MPPSAAQSQRLYELLRDGGTGCGVRLPAQQRVSESNQPGEFLFLHRDPVCGPGFIFSTGIRSGLLDQLTDILSYQGDAFVKFGNRGASHRLFSRVKNIQLSLVGFA